MPSLLSFLFSLRNLKLIFIFLITFTYCISAQRPLYKISATLDTVSHTLKGNIEITYKNNSHEALNELAIHLWADAYKVKNTALVKQKLHHGDLTLFRANEEDLGGLYDLKFISSNQDLNLIIDSVHTDIGWLQLSTPLVPGKAIIISSPFTLKIPLSFSRLGRTGDAYQIAQWYPHIPVYDEEGWHTMPYIDQGEFFNDFADYEITITVPASYTLAATGMLINEKSEGKSKTLFYKAENVIDFVWFASPTFHHDKKLVNVGSQQSVELNVYIDSKLNQGWDSTMIYAERALKFYSDWLGPYPYPQVSIVHTPFSRAGYMEYPMVAQIGYTSNAQLLDRVIAHEVGHTWLYGILANNERDHPWIDEGFNSFLEHEYMHTFYGHPDEIVFPKVVHSKHSMDHYEALQHMVRSGGSMVPPVTSPDQQTNDQYIFSAYMLPSQGLRLMMKQLGSATMRTMFRNYYESLKFTHISPEDIRYSFEKSCSCSLKWFFEDWLNHSHEIDYRIKKWDPHNNEVSIINKSAVNLPFSITEFSGGNEISTTVIAGFVGEKTIDIKEGTDEVRLYNNIMGVNKQWWKNIRPRNYVPVVSIAPKIGNYFRPSIAMTPLIGYNVADGGLPGLAITSTLIPQPRFKFLIMPMYGLKSKQLRLYSEGRYAGDIKNGLFDKYLIGLSHGNFGYQRDSIFNYTDHFIKLSPSIAFRLLPPSPFSHVTKWFRYRYVDIAQHYARGIPSDPQLFTKEIRHYGVHELSFQLSSDTVVSPYRAHITIQNGKGFLRLNMHYKRHFTGKDKMRGVWVHGFAGWLPVYNNPDANVRFSFNGISSLDYFSNDYMYDEWLAGRNAKEGNVSRQVFMKDAGLKTLANFGISESWMTGGGFSYALPFKVVHLYMDAAVYDSGITQKAALSYSGGVAIVLMKDVFEIYVPLLESKDIRESLTYLARDKWHERISFMANFKLANPLLLIDKYQYRYH